MGQYVSCHVFGFFSLDITQRYIHCRFFLNSICNQSQLTRVRKLGEHRFIICWHYEPRRSIVQVRIIMTQRYVFISYPQPMFSCSLHSAACCLFLLSCNIKDVPFVLFLNTAYRIESLHPPGHPVTANVFRQALCIRRANWSFVTGSPRLMLGVFALLQFLNFHVN